MAQITYCDNCNLDHIYKARYSTSTSPVRGVFVGTVEEAYKAGWEERDYGEACPDCVAEEAELEEAVDSQAGMGQIAAVVGFKEKDK